ncbi:MAG TPA: AAA family ATPase [Chthoniobacteraceae bacterium]|nr:AAA family ATPase [Chthoniobacteraceae bacterium]
MFFAIVRHFRLDENASAGGLSRGQRAGLCLALTLAPEPELLVLDDPALGLDPVARRSLLESMIYVTRGEGRTILFSSHLLSDVERVADRIAVMDRGSLKAECTVDEFRSRVRQFVLKFPGEPPPLPELPGLLHSFRTEGVITALFANANGIEEDLRRLTPQVEETPLGLEDAFIAYVGERGEKSFFLQEKETGK